MALRLGEELELVGATVSQTREAQPVTAPDGYQQVDSNLAGLCRRWVDLKLRTPLAVNGRVWHSKRLTGANGGVQAGLVPDGVSLTSS